MHIISLSWKVQGSETPGQIDRLLDNAHANKRTLLERDRTILEACTP